MNKETECFNCKMYKVIRGNRNHASINNDLKRVETLNDELDYWKKTIEQCNGCSILT